MKLARSMWMVALLAGALAPRVATAQPAGAPPSSPEALEEAKRAYAEGTEAEKAGDCKTAIARFEAAAAVKESPAVRLRIGRCREKLGLLGAALGDYERALQLAESDTAARELAEQLAAQLSNRVPRLKLLITDPPPDLEVTIDGKGVTPGSVPIRVDPGKRILRATARGKQPLELSVELAEGEVRSLTLSMLAEDAPPPPPQTPPTAEREPAPFPWLPVGFYAGGGVALGIGIPLLVISLGADADLDSRCFEASGAVSEDRDPCLAEDGSAYSAAEQEEIASEREAVNTQQVVGWVLVGVGAAAGGVATVLLLTGGDDDAAEAGVDRVTPLAGPGLAGVEIGGRF